MSYNKSLQHSGGARTRAGTATVAKQVAWRDDQSLQRTREAEARDRAEWTAREQMISTREAAIAAVERVQAAKALKKAKEKAAKDRARARAARNAE